MKITLALLALTGAIRIRDDTAGTTNAAESDPIEIEAAIDDDGTIFQNGKPILEIRGWNKPQKGEFRLQTGYNVFALYGKNSGGGPRNAAVSAAGKPGHASDWMCTQTKPAYDKWLYDPEYGFDETWKPARAIQEIRKSPKQRGVFPEHVWSTEQFWFDTDAKVKNQEIWCRNINVVPFNVQEPQPEPQPEPVPAPVDDGPRHIHHHVNATGGTNIHIHINVE